MSTENLMEFRILQLEEWQRQLRLDEKRATGAAAKLEQWQDGMEKWKAEQKQHWEDFIEKQEKRDEAHEKARRETRIAVYSTLILVVAEIVVAFLKH